MPLCRFMGDPPGPGEAKLRIRSKGAPEELEIVVVDETGVERVLLGVQGLTFGWKCGEVIETTVTVVETEIEADLTNVRVEPLEVA